MIKTAEELVCVILATGAVLAVIVALLKGYNF